LGDGGIIGAGINDIGQVFALRAYVGARLRIKVGLHWVSYAWRFGNFDSPKHSHDHV